MDARARFVLEADRSFLSFSALCRRHGISRPTGYKWLERFRKDGLDALLDRSHRPHTCPHATPVHVVERILEIRRHRGWGAPKIARLIRDEFGCAPCTDTVHQILRRHGLVQPKKSRRRKTPPGPPITPMDQPNAVWSADFKGQFRLGDRSLCFPLTIQDGYSRFLLDCHALPRLDLQITIERFRHLFRTRGLPDRIRTDNGHPFASRALGRLSQLSAWWIQLGIVPEFIDPGKPQQNGRHERMHRTLKERATKPPAQNLLAQQRRFNSFRRIFNHERPHQALDQDRPAAHYTRSARSLPRLLTPPDYPGHFEIRRVSQTGSIRWRSRAVPVSRVLVRQPVGLEEVGDGVWTVYYGPVPLGWLDERDFRIMDVRGRSRR